MLSPQQQFQVVAMLGLAKALVRTLHPLVITRCGVDELESVALLALVEAVASHVRSRGHMQPWAGRLIRQGLWRYVKRNRPLKPLPRDLVAENRSRQWHRLERVGREVDAFVASLPQGLARDCLQARLEGRPTISSVARRYGRTKQAASKACNKMLGKLRCELAEV